MASGMDHQSFGENMMRSMFQLLSGTQNSRRLNTFIFHRVLPEPDPIFPDEVDSRRFDQLLGWISSWFNVIPLDEAASCLRKGNLPPRAASITFDDGYEDNFSIAMPLLQKHRLPATFFIATGFIDGGRMWNDSVIEAIRKSSLPAIDLSALGLGSFPLTNIIEKRHAISCIISALKYDEFQSRADKSSQIAKFADAELPTNLMMTSTQVKAMQKAGMQIGAHTVTHPILARMDTKTAKKELIDSKEFLEGLLGETIKLFAYPNGKPGLDYHPEHADIARQAGFNAAVSTAVGVARSGGDPFNIPRFTPWDRRQLPFGLRLLRNYANP